MSSIKLLILCLMFVIKLELMLLILVLSPSIYRRNKLKCLLRKANRFL